MRGGSDKSGIGVHGAPLVQLPRERKNRSFNASLRRHYPHQVRRVCSHPTEREIAFVQDPYVAPRKLTPSSIAWQAQLAAGTHGERQANAVAFAFAPVAGVSRQGPYQLQAEAPDGLLRDQDRCVGRTKFTERIVRRSRVLIAQGEPRITGLKSDSHGRLTLLAISVGYGIRE